MARKSRIEAVEEIKAENLEVSIMVLSSFAVDEKVYSAIKAGVLRYRLKDASPQELLTAIREIHRGEPSLDPTIAHKLMCNL